MQAACQCTSLYCAAENLTQLLPQPVMVMPTGALPSFGEGDSTADGRPGSEFGHVPPPLTPVGSLGMLFIICKPKSEV